MMNCYNIGLIVESVVISMVGWVFEVDENEKMWVLGGLFYM